MTEKEKFYKWWDDEETAGRQIVNFRPFLNLDGIAKHFGAEVKIWYPVGEPLTIDDLPFEYIDWTNSSSSLDEREEFVYSCFNEMLNARVDAARITKLDRLLDGHLPVTKLDKEI